MHSNGLNRTWVKSSKQYISKMKNLNYKNFGVPQGSVLDHILFSLYTLHFKISWCSIPPVCCRHSNLWVFSHYIIRRMRSLQFWKIVYMMWRDGWQRTCFNWTHKTKWVIFGSPPQLRKLENSIFNAGGDIAEWASSARNIGIILDSVWSMADTEVCRLSFHQLRNLAHSRRYLTVDTTRTVVQALMSSKLD